MDEPTPPHHHYVAPPMTDEGLRQHLVERHGALFGHGRLDRLDDTEVLRHAHDHSHDVADHDHSHMSESDALHHIAERAQYFERLGAHLPPGSVEAVYARDVHLLLGLGRHRLTERT